MRLSKFFLAAVLLCRALSAAVAFDASAATTNSLGSVTSATVSLTIVGSSNIGVAVGVAESVTTSGALTVTVGGSAASLVTGTDSGTAQDYRIRLYCVALGSTTGAQTVSVSGMTANDAVIGAASFTGVNQTTPCAHGNQANGQDLTGAANAESVTITSASGNQVLVVGTSDSGGAVNTPTCTQKWNVVNSFTQGAAGQISAGAASVTCGWTINSFTRWVISGVDVQASGGAVTSGLFERAGMNGITTGGPFFANPISFQPLDVDLMEIRKRWKQLKEWIRRRREPLPGLTGWKHPNGSPVFEGQPEISREQAAAYRRQHACPELTQTSPRS